MTRKLFLLAAVALGGCSLGARSVAMMDPPTLPPDCVERLATIGHCVVEVPAGERVAAYRTNSPIERARR